MVTGCGHPSGLRIHRTTHPGHIVHRASFSVYLSHCLSLGMTWVPLFVYSIALVNKCSNSSCEAPLDIRLQRLCVGKGASGIAWGVKGGGVGLSACRAVSPFYWLWVLMQSTCVKFASRQSQYASLAVGQRRCLRLRERESEGDRDRDRDTVRVRVRTDSVRSSHMSKWILKADPLKRNERNEMESNSR